MSRLNFSKFAHKNLPYKIRFFYVTAHSVQVEVEVEIEVEGEIEVEVEIEVEIRSS